MSEQPDHTQQIQDDTIERLAQTVAHLALQLTIVQVQLRALGAAAAEAGVIDSARVEQSTANVARMHAGRYLQENLGEVLSDLVDVPELERQIIAYLSAGTGM